MISLGNAEPVITDKLAEVHLCSSHIDVTGGSVCAAISLMAQDSVRETGVTVNNTH